MNHDHEYTPGNGFTKWLDKRLPLIRFADENMLSFPTPKKFKLFLDVWIYFNFMFSHADYYRYCFSNALHT
jgi:hypothetical protein